jgi:hypothetical protein
VGFVIFVCNNVHVPCLHMSSHVCPSLVGLPLESGTAGFISNQQKRHAACIIDRHLLVVSLIDLPIVSSSCIFSTIYISGTSDPSLPPCSRNT